MKHKPNTPTTPFDNLILDEFEQDLESAFARGEYEETDKSEDLRPMLEEAAKRHVELQATKPVTLRIKQLDLIKIKAKAKEHDMPYQTLLSTLIHHYVEDKVTVRL